MEEVVLNTLKRLEKIYEINNKELKTRQESLLNSVIYGNMDSITYEQNLISDLLIMKDLKSKLDLLKTEIQILSSSIEYRQNN